jgi:hypothetical protein
MNLTKSDNFHRSPLWKTTLLFILVSGFLIGADQLSMRCGLEGSQRIADDLLGGLIAGSIFYLYEHKRLRRFSEHLHVIDLMNHHIRNALQPLLFLKYKPEGKAQMKLVEECVRRIDWALREVLPGKSDERFVIPPADRLEEVAEDLAENSSPETTCPRLEPANSQPNNFFRQWLCTWKSRNEGVRQ